MGPRIGVLPDRAVLLVTQNVRAIIEGLGYNRTVGVSNMKKPVRNPEGVFAAIRRGLSEFPDFRVCQLIVNATLNDPFYIEDNELIKAIDAAIIEWHKGERRDQDRLV